MTYFINYNFCNQNQKKRILILILRLFPVPKSFSGESKLFFSFLSPPPLCFIIFIHMTFWPCLIIYSYYFIALLFVKKIFFKLPVYLYLRSLTTPLESIHVSGVIQSWQETCKAGSKDDHQHVKSIWCTFFFYLALLMLPDKCEN